MTGTPGWINPEHYRTGPTGPGSDVFAWGALLAYADTGRLPFGTGAPDVVAFRVISGEPDLDGVPASLRQVVEKALTKEPDERPPAAATAGDMVTALWDVPAEADPAWHVPPERPRSRRRLAGAVVLVAAVVGGLAGGAAALMAQRRRHRRTGLLRRSLGVAPLLGRAHGRPRTPRKTIRREGNSKPRARTWRRMRRAGGRRVRLGARASTIWHVRSCTARESPLET